MRVLQYAAVKESKCQPFKGDHRQYMTVAGYTKKCGVPSDYMIKLRGENRWRRVRNYCTSNSGVWFVKTKDNPFLLVRDRDVRSI